MIPVWVLRVSWCQLLKMGKLEVKCLKHRASSLFFREFAMLRLVSNLIVNGNSRDQDEVTWMKVTLEWDS